MARCRMPRRRSACRGQSVGSSGMRLTCADDPIPTLRVVRMSETDRSHDVYVDVNARRNDCSSKLNAHVGRPLDEVFTVRWVRRLARRTVRRKARERAGKGAGLVVHPAPRADGRERKRSGRGERCRRNGSPEKRSRSRAATGCTRQCRSTAGGSTSTVRCRCLRPRAHARGAADRAGAAPSPPGNRASDRRPAGASSEAVSTGLRHGASPTDRPRPDILAR